MSWGATEEALPDGGDAGSTIDDVCQAWWVRIRKFLAILATDTSDTAIGSGADEDNPKVKDECIDSDAYVDGSIDPVHLAADCVEAGKIAASGVDADAIGDDATFENAQTRYYSVPLIGYEVHANIIARGVDVYFNNGPSGYFARLAVTLPHGATVTNLKSQCGTYTSGTVSVDLKRVTLAGAVSTLAETALNAVESDEDSSIANAVIDNSAYTYYVECIVDVNAVMDVNGVVITYTVTKPLP